MKISENWLREWVNPALTQQELCDLLTMSGLEVESIQAVAGAFSGVMIGEVVKKEKHPEADRLQVCKVNVGQEKLLTIVCGANNVSEGMKAPVAVEGAVLSEQLTIKATKLRGVFSEGMLCSPAELGLAESSEGLLHLPDDAPIGKTLWEYLNLSDSVIEIAITPNRGDCLSVLGMAQEISALTKTPIKINQTNDFTAPPYQLKGIQIKAQIKDKLPITVELPHDCPRYSGRVIRNVKADAPSPIWLQERLRRSGIRSISAVVDVMNYVMFELGQPMHAFDLAKISGGICVRGAKANESLSLLDGQHAQLKLDSLIIADHEKPLAIAGVMGGLDSGVTLLTTDIFLESAFFQPETIMSSCRLYNLGSESSYRFERGVDPELSIKAIERATELLLPIVGGEPGPVICAEQKNHIPQLKSILLHYNQIEKKLGLVIATKDVEDILIRLGFSLTKKEYGWDVTTPARRFDITAEIDLIEEVARVYGYDKIPLRHSQGLLSFVSKSEAVISLTMLRGLLCDLGYSEVVTYSFVDEKLQRLLDPAGEFKKLANPITQEMAVMRTTLWPGLINTLQYNQNRQQERIRIFETGLRFVNKDGGWEQQSVVSGLIYGQPLPLQWGINKRSLDFFDLKGDLQKLLNLSGPGGEYIFKPVNHPALHPGQAAEVHKNNQFIGIMGALNPNLKEQLKLEEPVFVFELLLDQVIKGHLPKFKEISKFPLIRRDIAILVDRTIPVQAIRDTIRNVAGHLLQEIKVFDIYEGKGIAPSNKSVALSLTLQHSSRTLIDDEVADLMGQVISALKGKFAAELRG